MSLTRTTCPSCGAGLKSAAGFNPGQQVRCPKCTTAFAVPAPAEFEEVADEAEAAPEPTRKGPPARAGRRDDDDDRPRKRRRRDDDDEDDDRPRKKGKKAAGGYKNSPLRFAILGLLLVVMGVLAFLLYQKKMAEREDAAAPAPVGGDDVGTEIPAPRPGPRPAPGPQGTTPPRPEPEFRPTGSGPTGAAMTRGREALKMIGLAMLNHHDASGTLPKAAITAPDGRPLLSWRVAILPYIEQDNLYRQFKLTEPWDSPANKPLIAQMPKTFQGTLPANEGKTAFKVFSGGGSAFDFRQGRMLRTITDGTSLTFGVVEAGRPVEWTKPEDIPFDGKTPPRLVPPTGGDAILVGMLDGSVRTLSLTRNGPEVILQAATAAGGEVVNIE